MINYIKYLILHIKMKSYHCIYCFKYFKHYSSLYKHRKKCELYIYQCSKNSDLKKKKIKTNENQYICKICQTIYNKSTYYYHYILCKVKHNTTIRFDYINFNLDYNDALSKINNIHNTIKFLIEFRYITIFKINKNYVKMNNIIYRPSTAIYELLLLSKKILKINITEHKDIINLMKIIKPMLI
jgi:hypothetical protein